MMPWGREGIARDVVTACAWEATARKVGNVHRYADFSDVSYLDFILSAGAAAPYLGDAPCTPLGDTIFDATEATYEAVKSNTNIGIVLLLAPLAAACGRGGIRRPELDARLSKLTVEDAVAVYAALRLVNPGGLGNAPEQDVRDEPTVTLLEAMALATNRDMVARQYAKGFADIFDFGVPLFTKAFERFGTVEAAVIDSQLYWLAAYPDSLIARKNGPVVAEDVRRRAADVLRLGGISTADGRRAGVALDRHLRSDGHRLNPGTTADLVTACLFVALRENSVRPAAPFRWDVPDWLNP